MKINGQTKVSAVIKHNMEAIDVIASINRNFKKLKNPILRAVLAPRVTLADASKIGKCDLEVIMNKLAEIGFEIEVDPHQQLTHVHDEIVDVIQIIEFLGSRKCDILDVRPLFNKNEDPFNTIMSFVKLLDSTMALEIINSFEPIPLIRILQNKGFEILCVSQDDYYRVFIKMGVSKLTNEITPTTTVSLAAFNEQLKAFDGHITEIDVRELEMPLPMVTILNELEELKKGNALFVFHKKIPQYLLPELQERGFVTLINEVDEATIHLLIYQ